MEQQTLLTITSFLRKKQQPYLSTRSSHYLTSPLPINTCWILGSATYTELACPTLIESNPNLYIYQINKH